MSEAEADMRKAFMALRLEVPGDIVDELVRRFDVYKAAEQERYDALLLAHLQKTVDAVKTKQKQTISCPWCAKYFTPKSHNQRFCCYSHKNLYHAANKRGAEPRKKKIAIAVL